MDRFFAAVHACISVCVWIMGIYMYLAGRGRSGKLVKTQDGFGIQARPAEPWLWVYICVLVGKVL